MSMIAVATVRALIAAMGTVAADDIMWSEAIRPPLNPEDFAAEAIFVICNSGMKNTVARRIYERVSMAITAGQPVGDVFGHKGKAAAIEQIWRDRQTLFDRFMQTDTKEAALANLAGLPWIGEITKYHLAKNFGIDVAKPDVHLQRLADRQGTSVQALCAELAAEMGLRVATIDLILWRACANGFLNSRTGAICLNPAAHAVIEAERQQGQLFTGAA